jgi:hypothetical protein
LDEREALGDIISIEISVAEGPGQAAIYRKQLAAC